MQIGLSFDGNPAFSRSFSGADWALENGITFKRFFTVTWENANRLQQKALGCNRNTLHALKKNGLSDDIQCITIPITDVG